MVSNNSESRVWAADSLIARISEGLQDGSLAKISKWQAINFDIKEVTQTLSTLETDIERADYIAYLCPALYLLIH